VLYTAILGLTSAYFIPRDLILFTGAMPDDIDEITFQKCDSTFSVAA